MYNLATLKGCGSSNSKTIILQGERRQWMGREAGMRTRVEVQCVLESPVPVIPEVQQWPCSRRVLLFFLSWMPWASTVPYLLKLIWNVFLSLATKTHVKAQQVTVSGLSILIFICNSPLSFDKWSGPIENFPPKHFPKFHSILPPYYN